MKSTFIAWLLVAAGLFWAPALPALETEAGEGSSVETRLSQPFSALIETRISRGEPLQALVLIHQTLAVQTSSSAGELLPLAHDLLQNHLDDTQLAEAAFMFYGSALGQDALLQQAVRASAKGDRATALRLTESLISSATPFLYRPEAVRLWEQLTGKSWLQRAVGVLLPLSGRFSTFGELVRRGMDLALEMHQDAGKRPVHFIYRDTGADPALAKRAVIELADGERVMAIAGPLTGADAHAAATQAQQSGIPLLALSQREGLPETGDQIFRDSLTSQQQAAALVRFAMEDRQLTSFAVLNPENRLGEEMAELFASEVEARGGRVAVRQSYAENTTDFRRQIKLLKRENPESSDPAPAGPGKPAPAAKPLPFEALFIPDNADRVALIAPQLAYYGIEQLPLLGINSWNSQDLIRLAGQFVEGAVFVDGFYRYSPSPVVQEFVDRYFDKYGDEPSILEAQGFDAAGILLSILERPGIRTRQDLRLALAETQNYPGVTGATSFTPHGDAEKVLFLLQVQNGSIVQVN